MPHFFAYLIVLCSQKCYFLIKNLIFGVHILISFSPYNKSPSSIFLEELFFFIKLKFKLHQIHLACHELIREMGINSTHKSFRTIPHPSIYNVRSYILHTGRRKSMAQVILLFNLHYHKQLFTLYFQSITSHK